MPVGRPSKKTPEIVNKLIEAFHDDATIEQACYIAGITKPTYYDWLKEDEVFSYEMSKAQEYLMVISKRTLRKAVEKGDEKTALEIIKRREKHRYSERTETDITSGGKPIPILGGITSVSSNNGDSQDRQTN